MKQSINSLLDSLETYIPKYSLSNTQISKTDIGWHIEHVLLTVNGIVTAIAHSKPEDFKSRFSFFKYLVLITKKIPRGKGRAPKVVAPTVAYTEASLQEHLRSTREKIKQLESVSKDHFFEHPYFGCMKKRQTIYFIKIHSLHHLKIIQDIVR